MRKRRVYLLGAIGGLLMAAELFLAQQPAAQGQRERSLSIFSLPDETGAIQTVFSDGRAIDTNNPFFEPLGTNGRACSTCHAPENAWSVSPLSIQRRFRETRGTDPLFRLNDGAVSPLADVSTPAARRRAYRMLLTRGLIRVGLPIPDGAEFALVGCDDPYGYASARELSLFRRPLPSANLRFLSTVMWDGRETVHSISGEEAQCRQALLDNLRGQAQNATTGHAQAVGLLTSTQIEQIVDFEMNIYTAQAFDWAAGLLYRHEGRGGAVDLSDQPFYIGINDVLQGDYQTHAPFDSSAMTLYSRWRNSGNPYRAAIARGEILFNTKPIAITGVGGLNDALRLPVINGTCTTCHDSPNVGHHSVALPIDIGLADASRRTRDMPLYTLQNRRTGETVQTTDPGRALITGHWSDIGKFKGPILRGLAARAPYFHNGSAATLGDVVNFYNQRFGIHFTPREKADLVAFLRAL